MHLHLWTAQFRQTSWIALRAIRRNLLRSCLTALGIIIGVAAVVAMVALGNGAQASITQKISALGENLLTVFAGNNRTGGVSAGTGSANSLTVEDAVAIGREVAEVQSISPEVSAQIQVLANGRNWGTTLAGVSPEYLAIRNWQLGAGTFIDAAHTRGAARVAVLGSKVALELFGPLDPVGQTIRVGNVPFQVIGTLQSKGAGFGGQNQDDRLLIPYTTAMRRVTGDRYLRTVNDQVKAAALMPAAQRQITMLLRQRHRLLEGQADDFSIFNQKDIADTVGSVAGIIKLLLGAVSGLSLLVGGIGIMNIMLVSVTERTREIGIRMAVGAQSGAIQLQFLMEALTLSLLGGTVGVILGILVSRIVAGQFNFPFVVSPASIALAFGVSFAIGVFFGIFPAIKAARLDPIIALRFE